VLFRNLLGPKSQAYMPIYCLSGLSKDVVMAEWLRSNELETPWKAVLMACLIVYPRIAWRV
jgi:hypothetical protein